MELGIQVTRRVIHGVIFATRIMSLVYSIEDRLECNIVIRGVLAILEIRFDVEWVKHDVGKISRLVLRKSFLGI